MDILVNYVFNLADVIIGAIAINESVKQFKRKKYFWFGWWVMIFVWVLVLFVKSIWR